MGGGSGVPHASFVSASAYVFFFLFPWGFPCGESGLAVGEGGVEGGSAKVVIDKSNVRALVRWAVVVIRCGGSGGREGDVVGCQWLVGNLAGS